jgi:ethanolamine ammonia-lyase small subunit
VKQGRVAVGDDVGQCFNAKAVLVLIGERPGLTSPDSMGMYLTWGAKRGSKDSDRNCISNVRPQGLNYDDACQRAFYLLKEARRLQLSGVNLKDRSAIDEESGGNLEDKHNNNFLISKM